jgi:hypothetical protein
MDHPPFQRQKLPAFFHGLTSCKNSYQQSAFSFSPGPCLDEDVQPVGVALRPIALAKNNRGRLFHPHFAKQ